MVDDMDTDPECKAKATIMDAKTYEGKINNLCLGKYTIVSTIKFPGYVEITDSIVLGSGKKVEILELTSLKLGENTLFCEMCDKMLEQLKPHLEKHEAAIYIQRIIKIPQ